MKNKQVKQSMIDVYAVRLEPMYYCKRYQNIETAIRFLSGMFWGFNTRIGSVSLTGNQLKGE